MENYYENYWSSEGVNPSGVLSVQVRDVIESIAGQNLRCLDIGCGDGRTYGNWIQTRVGQYVGVDVSENAVNMAKSLGLDARRIGDASDLPFNNAEFDLAICMEVLEHLFDPLLAVKEAKRVLKPGGVLVVTVPNVTFWRTRLRFALLGQWDPRGAPNSRTQPWCDPHLRFFTPNTLGIMLKISGMTVVRIGGLEGGGIGRLPLVGRRFMGSDASSAYRSLERRFPGLFGSRIYAICVKPSN